MTRRVLRPYQKDMLNYMIRQRHSALFVEMRLGKTLVVVRRMNMMPWLNMNLVVGPYGVFNSWRKELHLEGGHELIELTGTARERREILKNPGRWYIINKEGHRILPELADLPWTSITLDESRFIANPKSKSSKFYTENFRQAVFRNVLSGTPAPEGKHEYFQQLKFLDRKYFDFKDFWSFRAKLFAPDQFGRDWQPTLEGEEYINLVLAQNVFFLTRKDAGLGSVKIHQVRTIPLPVAARKVYHTVCKEYVLEYDGQVDKTKFATAKHLWLRRLYGGQVRGKFVFDHKITDLVELLQGELRREKVIIACQFVDEVEYVSSVLRGKGRTNHRIHGAYPKHKEHRDVLIKEFQDGKVQDLVVEPECFKYAKDFSQATTMVFFSTPESLETRQQFEDRMVDVSKGNPLLYIDLVCENTTEQDIVDSLVLKEGRQAMTRRIVQRMQKEAMS